MWDLNSPTRDQTYTPCIGRQSLNHWTTREVSARLFLTWALWSPGFHSLVCLPTLQDQFQVPPTWNPSPPTPSYTKLSLPWNLDQSSYCSMLSMVDAGVGNGNPLQYSCLENPTDRGVWWATVHRVAKSWTRLSHWVWAWLILSPHMDHKTFWYRSAAHPSNTLDFLWWWWWFSR